MVWPATWGERLPESLRTSATRAVRRPNPGTTPELLMAALGHGPAALLDGLVLGGRKTTVVGWDPLWRLSARRGTVSGAAGGPLPAVAADPLDLLQATLPLIPRHPEWPLGVIGVLGYEALTPTDHSGDLWPDAWFIYPGALVAFEKDDIVLVVTGPEAELDQRLAAVAERVEAVAGASAVAAALPPARRQGGRLSAAPYAARGPRLRAPSGRGARAQGGLAVRFDVATAADPPAVYQRYAAAPGALRFCVRDGGATLLGATPELLVRLEGGHCVMRPLAGTRRRGRTPAEDTALLANLQAHPKDAHEHLVAVLQCERDLATVCEPDSVRVTERLSVEIYPLVMHLASQVEGRLRPDVGAAQLVRACFPAGTVAGVPRAPALHLLRELEPVPRGPYAGAVGYWQPGEDLQLFLSIRCLLLAGGMARVQTGAGIVAGSDPESEYRECWLKASGALRALGVDEALMARQLS